jgi:hypothetical protein
VEKLFSYEDEINTAKLLRERAAIIEDGMEEWAEALRSVAAACEFKARMILRWESHPISLEAQQFFAERKNGRPRKTG